MVRKSTPKHIIVTAWGSVVSDEMSRTMANRICASLNRGAAKSDRCEVWRVIDWNAYQARRAARRA